MSLLRVEIDNGIATVTLDNPPLNVVTLGLTSQMSELLDELAGNPEVRVLVLTGAGDRVFCAGSDIKEFADFIGPDGRVLERKLIAENEMYSKLDKFPKPTVAAVNGHALGGGLELAVCCDLLVSSETARLSLPEVNLGVIPGSGGTIRTTRRIGEGRAKELVLLGEPISAETALRWGLVNRIAAPEQVLAEAQALATRLAGLPNVALQTAKQAIDLTFDMDEPEAIQQTLPLSERVFQSDDAAEGARAFFAKETPNFTHQ